jgi:hypothetical protein
MNGSFSKIRHIQESNLMLEKRLLKEQPESRFGMHNLSEQSTPQTIKSDPNAVKSTEELIKNIKSGFCIPSYEYGSRTRIDCKDKRYYEIRYYRRFGQS